MIKYETGKYIPDMIHDTRVRRENHAAVKWIYCIYQQPFRRTIKGISNIQLTIPLIYDII